ncbi:MAG TPA: carboxypeptidase regulatory-like domain-containing protein [Planctomycetes bacterium]|nr:carboxypeptidase regulatory-like domain-containing protein [Planctomycetota bacterium]
MSHLNTRLYLSVALLGLAVLLLVRAFVDEKEEARMVPSLSGGVLDRGPRRAEVPLQQDEGDGVVESRVETPVDDVSGPIDAEEGNTEKARIHVSWETGKGVPNVGVVVADAVSEEVPFKGRTDSSGDCLVRGLEKGPYKVFTDRGSFNTFMIDGSGGEVVVSVELSSGGLIRGRVIAGVGGDPVDGASVFARPFAHPSTTFEIAKSDSLGRFEVAGMVKPTLLFARSEEFGESEQRPASPGQRDSIVIPFRGRGGAATFSIVEAGDVQRTNGYLGIVRIGDPSQESESGRTGRAKRKKGSDIRIEKLNPSGTTIVSGLSVGLYEYCVVAERSAPIIGTVEVLEGTGAFVPIVANDGGAAVGRVVDKSRAGIGNAEVLWRWRHSSFFSRQTHSKASGEYSVVGLPVGEWTLEARLPRARVRRTVAIAAGSNAEVDFVFPDEVSLEGTCIDNGGRGIQGLRIRAEPFGGFGPQFASAQSDSEGRFRLENLQAVAQEVSVSDGRGPEPILVTRWLPGDGPLSIVVPNALRATSFVSGQLKDSAGNPPVGEVYLSQDGRPESSTIFVLRAKDGGRFQFGPIPRGAYQLAFSQGASGLVPLKKVELRPESRVDVGTLLLPEKKGRVRLVVEWKGFAIKPTLKVALEGPVRAMPLAAAGENRFEVSVWPGEYVLRIEGSGVASCGVPVKVKSSETVKVVQLVYPGVRTILRFSFPTENTVADYQFRIASIEPDVVVFRGGAMTSQAVYVRELRLVPGPYRVTGEVNGVRFDKRFLVEEKVAGDQAVIVEVWVGNRR